MMKNKLLSKLKKWHLALKIVPILILIFILKLIFHKFGFEVITLNALFTSLIAATIFLIGFLISGVISDYKESEKIPGEMAASLQTFYDEIYVLNKNKDIKAAKDLMAHHKDVVRSLHKWFYREERTRDMLDKLDKYNDYFAELEPVMQAGFLTRMKAEQSNIRKMLIRIDTIRDTSFVQSAYAIVEALGVFLVIGLLLLKLEPFYEAMFFTLIVSFVVIYMVFLIKDLDDPFDYSRHGESGTEISLKMFHDISDRILGNKK